MSYSKPQNPPSTPLAGGTGDCRSQPHSPTSGKKICPFEEHVVKDAIVSRIMLMILRDFVHREAVYDRAKNEETKFCCPIMKCYQGFDEPMGLVGHLLECKMLRFGEINCFRCKDWHRYPITEREWREWEGWQAEAPPAINFKKRFSEFSDSIARALRSPSWRNAPSSPGGSASVAVKSPSSHGSMWSTEEINLHDKMSSVTSPVQQKTQDEKSKYFPELHDTGIIMELPNPPPPPCYSQTSSDSFMSGQNSSFSESSPPTMFEMPSSQWDYSGSSFDSSHATTHRLRVNAEESSYQFLDTLTQSPDGMRVGPVEKELAWQSTHAPGYAADVSSKPDTFMSTPDSRVMGADYAPISTINEPLISSQVDSWILDDDSQFLWLQHHMRPAQELGLNFMTMGQDSTALNLGAADPCLPVLDLAPVCEFECEERASVYKCDQCDWQPEEKGKPENFANYLRKHRQTHLGLKYYCKHPGCKRSYSRPDNLGKHAKKDHAGSIGGDGSPSSCQSRGANKRRVTNSSTL